MWNIFHITSDAVRKKSILEKKLKIRVCYEKGLSAVEFHSECGQDCIIAFAVQEQMKLAEGRFKINLTFL